MTLLDVTRVHSGMVCQVRNGDIILVPGISRRRGVLELVVVVDGRGDLQGESSCVAHRHGSGARGTGTVGWKCFFAIHAELEGLVAARSGDKDFLGSNGAIGTDMARSHSGLSVCKYETLSLA